MNSKFLKSLKKYPFNKNNFRLLPKRPGIYIYFNNEGTPIYIGKSINLFERVRTYKLELLSDKTAKLVSNISYFSFIEVLSEVEALILEANLIKFFKPKFNIALKDDKNYLYIRITRDKYPRVLTARKTEEKDNNDLFLGPFPSAKSVKLILRFLRKIFPYSQHLIQNKPCFYHQIGLCDPCPSIIEKIGSELLKSDFRKIYLKNIKNIKKILSGKTDNISSVLSKLIKEYSADENYEAADKVKKVLENIDYISQKITPSSFYLQNPNLAQDIYSDELKSLFFILKKFNLSQKIPVRIEGFDISHIQGKFVTASMVTFINGLEEKSLYRRFRLYNKSGNDDYASLHEIAQRRLKHLSDWGKPDLLLIDGGKGQVSVFSEVFRNENIPVVGLAKRFETLIIPAYLNTDTYVEYKLPNIPAKNLVIRIRNESHRFARVYHHLLFKKNLIPQN